MKTRTLALIATFLVAGAAQAALTIYTGADSLANSSDPRPNSDAAAAALDLAVGTFGLIDFESAPVGSFTGLTLAPGVNLTGTDYSGGYQTILDASAYTPDNIFGYNTTAGGAKFASFYGGFMTLTFATPITAFGAYFTGGQLVNSVTALYESGATETIYATLVAGGSEFIGFTSTENITLVYMDGTNDIIGVDDIRYSAVPEPATMLALALGLASAARRRRT